MGLFAAALAVAVAQAPADRTEAQRRRRTPVVEVFDQCKGAVVNISTTSIVEVQDDLGDLGWMFRGDPILGGQRRKVEARSVGSGFVIHRGGYIVTNAHVVARTETRKVVFDDQREFDAQIVGLDADADLAVLKISPDRPLPELKLGRSDDLMVGETVIAIGNPLGLKHTVTAGVVSALDRTLDVDERPKFTGLVQSDASINPGNSGGPLLNVLGELVGVNFAIRNDGQNIGFAIPVDRLADALPDLLDVERRYRIQSGLRLAPGLLPAVLEAPPELPAGAAGLKLGDVVRAVNGQPIGKGIDFHIELISRQPGEEIKVAFDRDGKRFETAFKLIAKPKPDGAALALEKLGAAVQELDEETARKLGRRFASGMLLSQVEAGGPLGKAGAQEGDVLVSLGGAELPTLEDLGLLLEKSKAGQPVRVALLRATRRGLYRVLTRVAPR